jgi:hypothetical protein
VQLKSSSGHEAVVSAVQSYGQMDDTGLVAIDGDAWYGMVWYGMAWYGMAWHGMAWRGIHYSPKSLEP